MKRNLFMTVSALALTAASGANAQPVYSWQGFYVGINGGAAWHRAAVDVSIVGPFDSASLTASSATFGGQIGANWQSQTLVYGIEADLNWLDAKSTTLSPLFADFASALSWLGTVRGRIGTLLGPATLLYVTGGLAAGQVKSNYLGTSLTESGTKIGWTVGGGIEHMLTPMWTAKAEVLYIDLGTTTVTSGYVGRFSHQAWLGRVGLNLKW